MTTTNKQTTQRLTVLLVLAVAAAVTAGVALADNTYLYVNTSGQLQSYQADTANEAITGPLNIADNSGVILVSEYNDLAEEDNGTTYSSDGKTRYAYVSTSGNILYVMANSPTEAINSADNIADDSGVLETEEFDEDLE